MKIKNISEMDYYELLNIDRNASIQEIERAYELCKITYQSDSIAYHSLLSEEERQHIWNRIENAYATLRNTKKRKSYDFEMYENKTDFRERAFFRKTTEKILIEDTAEKDSIWRRLKYLFFSPRKR
jgi:DnaJ-class molecular chaperone